MALMASAKLCQALPNPGARVAGDGSLAGFGVRVSPEIADLRIRTDLVRSRILETESQESTPLPDPKIAASTELYHLCCCQRGLLLAFLGSCCFFLLFLLHYGFTTHNLRGAPKRREEVARWETESLLTPQQRSTH